MGRVHIERWTIALCFALTLGFASALRHPTTLHEAVNGDCRPEEIQDEGQRCAYVLAHRTECQPRSGLLHYTAIYYCSGLQKCDPLAALLTLAWIAFLFFIMFTASDRFFCPSLELLSQMLRLSPAVAGATLLAFGNGAPDVFSQIAAIHSGGAEVTTSSVSMALSEPMGTGMFVGNVVLGLTVAMASCLHQVSLDRAAFIKDVLFYLAAVSGVLAAMLWGHIYLWQCLLLLGGYVSYVALTVWLSREQERVKLDPLYHEVPRLVPYGPWDDLDSDEMEDWDWLEALPPELREASHAPGPPHPPLHPPLHPAPPAPLHTGPGLAPGHPPHPHPAHGPATLLCPEVPGSFPPASPSGEWRVKVAGRQGPAGEGEGGGPGEGQSVYTLPQAPSQRQMEGLVHLVRTVTQKYAYSHAGGGGLTRSNTPRGGSPEEVSVADAGASSPGASFRSPRSSTSYLTPHHTPSHTSYHSPPLTPPLTPNRPPLHDLSFHAVNLLHAAGPGLAPLFQGGTAAVGAAGPLPRQFSDSAAVAAVAVLAAEEQQQQQALPPAGVGRAGWVRARTAAGWGGQAEESVYVPLLLGREGRAGGLGLGATEGGRGGGEGRAAAPPGQPGPLPFTRTSLPLAPPPAPGTQPQGRPPPPLLRSSSDRRPGPRTRPLPLPRMAPSPEARSKLSQAGRLSRAGAGGRAHRGGGPGVAGPDPVLGAAWPPTADLLGQEADSSLDAKGGEGEEAGTGGPGWRGEGGLPVPLWTQTELAQEHRRLRKLLYYGHHQALWEAGQAGREGPGRVPGCASWAGGEAGGGRLIAGLDLGCEGEGKEGGGGVEGRGSAGWRAGVPVAGGAVWGRPSLAGIQGEGEGQGQGQQQQQPAGFIPEAAIATRASAPAAVVLTLGGEGGGQALLLGGGQGGGGQGVGGQGGGWVPEDPQPEKDRIVEGVLGSAGRAKLEGGGRDAAAAEVRRAEGVLQRLAAGEGPEEPDAQGLARRAERLHLSRQRLAWLLWRALRRPVVVAMSLTMPAIERSKVVRYSKTYAVLLPLVAPLVAALYAGWWEPWGPGGFAGGGDPALRPDGGGVTPGLRLAMGVCVLLAVATAVWYPRDGLLHGLLLHACTLLAFLGSMMWMNAAADELVGLLVAVGNIMELPPALLGATVLAWGNSLSDAVSNTTMARDGYPTMAITACFASPLFILLAGVACTLSYGARTGAMAMPQDLPTLTLFATSCLNIIMWALLVPFVFKFKLDRRITFIGMAFYATFQVVFVTIVLRQAES